MTTSLDVIRYGMQSTNGLDIENGGAHIDGLAANGRPNLYYAPHSPGWRLSDIDWKFVFMSQHYGTIVWSATGSSWQFLPLILEDSLNELGQTPSSVVQLIKPHLAVGAFSSLDHWLSRTGCRNQT